jgi:drug/metabolite transporter (DMT)-like permease
MILFVGYLFGFVWFTFQAKHSKHISTPKRAKRIGFYWGIGSGLFSFAGMQIYALALEEGPASIVSPIFATNSLVVAILSIWIFRERLSLIQTLSLIILFTGLICIRL